MEPEIRYDITSVDWQKVADTLKSVGMAYGEADLHRRAFAASHTTIFVYHENELIGFGRAISDGAYQAAVYDVAVVPEFQKKGIGTIIMKRILERVAGCNVILYAAPGKEEFYQSMGMRKMKTAMALFKSQAAMVEKGFLY